MSSLVSGAQHAISGNCFTAQLYRKLSMYCLHRHFSMKGVANGFVLRQRRILQAATTAADLVPLGRVRGLSPGMSHGDGSAVERQRSRNFRTAPWASSPSIESDSQSRAWPTVSCHEMSRHQFSCCFAYLVVSGSLRASFSTHSSTTVSSSAAERRG